MAALPLASGSASRGGSVGKNLIFRTRGWLRYSVGLAIAFWVVMFAWLAVLHDRSGHGFVGIGFFLVLFTTLSIFYNSTCVEVTGDYVILRGVMSLRLVPFSDILKVEVVPGFLQTTYSVRARRGFVMFTSLIADHRRLLEIIVDRAGLAPN